MTTKMHDQVMTGLRRPSGVTSTELKIHRQAERIAREVGRPLNRFEMARLTYAYKSKDRLELRAMWRRQGMPLCRRASVFDGKVARFIAP